MSLYGIDVTRKTFNCLTDAEKIKAVRYISGKIDEYLAIENKPFSVRVLFGGYNRDWSETPLQNIYTYYCKLYRDRGHSDYKERAKKQSAKDVGDLLKTAMYESAKCFEFYEYSAQTNWYKLK